MKIETMRLKDVKQCLDIFNETTKQSNFLYEPLTIEQFKTKFLKSGGDYLVLSFVLKEAEENHLINLKGHRSVGGMRASIYNAMPIEGVIALTNFMKDFEDRHYS